MTLRRSPRAEKIREEISGDKIAHPKNQTMFLVALGRGVPPS
jgi:hypothetical protein